jgi:hypothetical protein
MIAQIACSRATCQNTDTDLPKHGKASAEPSRATLSHAERAPDPATPAFHLEKHPKKIAHAEFSALADGLASKPKRLHEAGNRPRQSSQPLP